MSSCWLPARTSTKQLRSPARSPYYCGRLCALAVLLAAAIMSSSVQGQSRPSPDVPDHFEYFQGHAYMGGEWVKWEHDRLVLTKRVADMKGDGKFDETRERLNPPPQAWKRFWARIDSLDVWQWKSDYHDPKRDLPDGESWSLTLGHGTKQVKSKGYNATPEAYSAFRDAVRGLVEDASRR
jgi:hypothetical protein